MTEQFANSASTYLTSGAGTGDVTLNVASTTAFPSSFPFRLLVDSEIMLCTGKGASDFTVTRAQEGTILATHASSATVACVLTAGALAQLKIDAVAALSALVQSGTGDPESVVTAPVGTLFLRTDGGTSTTLYVKETGGSGNTGWVPK